MTKKFLIQERSAIGWNTKQSTLFQEGMRRVRNCSLELSWDVRRHHLNHFCWQMYISGYKKGVVINIVRGVLKRYKQMLESDSEGTTPLWRSRSQIMTMKKAKPGRTSSNWFMKGDNRQFMCLPVTPGGHLVSRMRKELGTFKGPDKGTTKYSERAGRSILAGISKDDPFPKVGCTFGDPECLVGPGCDKGGVCYEILCKECIPDA